MPTHHYNHIFIRTQFLGQVLAALLAACSQQIAWVCDLLVETGSRKCCRDAGGEAASRPGMNLESRSPSLAAYSQADVGQALRGFLHSFQPCASLSLCLFLTRAQAGSPLTCQCCGGLMIRCWGRQSHFSPSGWNFWLLCTLHPAQCAQQLGNGPTA